MNMLFENEEENIFEEEEDVILPDDFEDIPTSDEEGEEEPAEPQTEPTSEVENAVQTDDQKLLDYLNTKDIKYNGEKVNVGSLDDLIATYQKGLNYDNLKSKSEKSENAIMNYIMEKSKSMGLTPEQYIDNVKSYEEEQIKAKNEQAIQSMVTNGVPEEIAREVIETRALRETLQRQQAELTEKENVRKAEEKKNQEYEEFLKAYPDIEVDKIPAEVFENAKNLNLKSAYAEYENKLLKEELKQIKQNQKNASSSVVKSVTETGAVEQQSNDAFLEGFDSVD